MIEAPELVTATQRELHDRYTDIHRKFFPSPPVFSRPQPKVAMPPVVAVPVEPEKPISKPTRAPGPPITLDQTNLRLKIIKELVCAEFDITQLAIVSERRMPKFVLPRHMFYYLASRFTKASLPRMGKSLGGQDHTTALHAIRRTKVRIGTDIAVYKQVMRLEAILRQAFGETNTPRNCIGRYVIHERVQDHFMLGWMWAANLNEYAALMIWPCACECVEPKDG